MAHLCPAHSIFPASNTPTLTNQLINSPVRAQVHALEEEK